MFNTSNGPSRHHRSHLPPRRCMGVNAAPSPLLRHNPESTAAIHSSRDTATEEPADGVTRRAAPAGFAPSAASRQRAHPGSGCGPDQLSNLRALMSSTGSMRNGPSQQIAHLVDQAGRGRRLAGQLAASAGGHLLMTGAPWGCRGAGLECKGGVPLARSGPPSGRACPRPEEKTTLAHFSLPRFASLSMS
jgi:hypothetical protein